jgi:ABC-type transport system involved in multi-copper enzyme maturation permease subunit
MSQEAITDQKPDAPAPGDWRPPRERAPSVTLPDEPQVARWVGTAGLTMIAMGTITLYMYFAHQRVGLIPLPVAGFFVAAGVGCLLFHAASDRDMQVRRIYGALGGFLVAAGILVSSVPLQGRPAGSQFLPYGFAGLTFGLLFLLPFVRNEEDVSLRTNTIRGIGAVGVALALIGLIGGNVSADFLLTHGVLLTVLGLVYLWAFASSLGVTSEYGYRTALAVGAVGLLVFVVALGRTILPPLFYKWGWLRPPAPVPYFIPAGLLLMTLGLLYAALSVGLYSENKLVVQTRRELQAFFYSPIAYLVLLAFTAFACYSYWNFVGNRLLGTERTFGNPTLPEPIVFFYYFDLFPVMFVVGVVPAITMRLLSEEQRSGTLEVLLTAPVNETTIVLSKFLAALAFFFLCWVPSLLCLLALRVLGREEFDYRPLLSFAVALLCAGANFVGMGLFFSALTRNQIVAFVFTLAAMLGMTFLLFQQTSQFFGESLAPVVRHVSYLNLWQTTLMGKLPPQDLLIQVCAAAFWLFLTIKVLEARKWR